jgi:hypothetical protein
MPEDFPFVTDLELKKIRDLDPARFPGPVLNPILNSAILHPNWPIGGCREGAYASDYRQNLGASTLDIQRAGHNHWTLLAYFRVLPYVTHESTRIPPLDKGETPKEFVINEHYFPVLYFKNVEFDIQSCKDETSSLISEDDYYHQYSSFILSPKQKRTTTWRFHNKGLRRIRRQLYRTPPAFKVIQPDAVQMSSVTTSDDDTNDWDPGDPTSGEESDDDIDLGSILNFQSSLSIFTDDPFEQFIFDF